MDFSRVEYHVPQECDKCGSLELTYKGLGEYVCNKCGETLYDDYGLVRNYIENHKGSSARMAADATGVSVAKIRKMIEENKFEFQSTQRRDTY